MSTHAPAPGAIQPSGEELSRVWQPLRVGPMHLKNRILVPARVLNYAEDGLISDRHLATYRELALGGPAMIVTEQHAAHPVSKGSFHMPCTAWDRAAIPRFERFAEIVHAEGCRGVVQLFGSGVHDKGTMIMDEWHPLWGVSRIPSFVHGEVPLVMEREHIREMVVGFGRSALNVALGGLDGVEVHAAHAYLLGQFLSRSYNIRDDEYGGSVQNRCRAIVEIGREIREQVGGDLAVGVRLSFDEFLGPAGIEPDEAEEQLEILAGSGLFDYFSISGGGYHTLHMAVAPMGSTPDGFMVPFAERAKAIVADRAKVFVVGRIRDLHTAERALASGATDMVAMGRAQLADPHLVRKTKEGREHEIVRCVGLNECIGRLFDQREVVCAMNPVTGRERQWGQGTLRPTPAPKRVVVVGGGPAGTKVASVAARRGHRVTLMEREAELGGNFRLLSRLPGRGEWGIAMDNCRRWAETPGVELLLGTEATAESLRAHEADVIVFATGSRYDRTGLTPYRPDRQAIPGADAEHVLDVRTAARRALDDPHALGAKVIILDESGTYLPLGLAEVLATAGVTVEVLTPALFVGEQTFRSLDLPHLFPRLTAAGVRLTAQHFVERIDGPTVDVYDLWGGDPRREEGVDTVVLSMYRLPEDALARDLGEPEGTELHRIGDCLAPRAPAAVIYDGEKLGREL